MLRTDHVYSKCALDPPLQRIPSGMGVVVWLVYRLFLYLLRSNLIATLVSIVAGVFTYATLLLMLKGLTEQEILRFPKGRTLVKLARKMHLLR